VSATEHDRFQDDVGVYLLGALEDGERSDFERHLATCHVCHDELERLRGAADALPRSVEQYDPPPAVKRALMEHVYAEAGTARPARRPNLRRLFARPQLAAVAAAVVLLVGVGAGLAISQLGGEEGGTRTIAAQVDATRASNGRAVVVLPKAGGPGHLRVSGMPELPPGKVYEIWLKRGNRIEPGPLFSVDRNGTGAGAIPDNLKGVDQVMVTRERTGGAPQPTEPPLITAKV
jgi:anti-sigma-K factor RskA